MTSGNRVSLRSDGIIEVAYVGDQTPEHAVAATRESAALVQTVKEQHHPINFLLDLTQLGKFPVFTRAAGSRAQRDIPYDRVAIYGASRMLQYAMRFMIIVNRKTSSVQLFPNRNSAERWLLHGSG